MTLARSLSDGDLHRMQYARVQEELLALSMELRRERESRLEDRMEMDRERRDTHRRLGELETVLKDMKLREEALQKELNKLMQGEGGGDVNRSRRRSSINEVLAQYTRVNYTNRRKSTSGFDGYDFSWGESFQIALKIR